jgi:hypothetical protein
MANLGAETLKVLCFFKSIMVRVQCFLVPLSVLKRLAQPLGHPVWMVPDSTSTLSRSGEGGMTSRCWKEKCLSVYLSPVALRRVWGQIPLKVSLVSAAKKGRKFPEPITRSGTMPLGYHVNTCMHINRYPRT